MNKIDENTLDEIRKLNDLDIKLYEYAKELLEKRYEMLKKADDHFHEHFDNMGNVQISFQDIEDEN